MLKYRYKETIEERKQLLEQVTQFFIYIIKKDGVICANEINVLYGLLHNIFRRENMSLEVFIRNIVNRTNESPQNSIEIDKVVSFLNHHLSAIDKSRILLSLIVMAQSGENIFTLEEITDILDYARCLDLESERFMTMFQAIEGKTFQLASLRNFTNLNVIESSIFTDFVLFGNGDMCHIQFRDKNISDIEIALFMIEDLVFVSTGQHSHTYMDGMLLSANQLYLVSAGHSIQIGNFEFTIETLSKLYRNQDVQDVLHFKRQAYDFDIINTRCRYSVFLNSGSFNRNGKRVPKKTQIALYYDDTFSVPGFDEFNMLEFINSNVEIGSLTINPTELYIDYNAEFFSINQMETSHSVLKIDISDGQHIINPPIKKVWAVYLNNLLISAPTPLTLNTDIITINKRNFRINNYYDLTEVPFEVEQLSLVDLRHHFPDGSMALDSISLDMHKGELVGILGQSGCGKSSLLKTICGEILPNNGSVQFDGKDYYENIDFFSQYVGYVPQDDLLFSNLSVYENLWYRGKLRIAKITNEHLEHRINNILLKTNLNHKKNTKVGDAKNKFLSGGERRRLNLALELLFDPTIIICDEPTSGLSYIDAEQIIDILKSYTAQGKIVILTIHQPNTNVFHKFNKVLIMDRGGKQVYYGTPDDMWTYFDKEYHELKQSSHYLEDKDIPLHTGFVTSLSTIEKKREERQPEYAQIIIEYPDLKDTGEIIYERTGRNLSKKRKFTPEYWRDKFKRKMLYEIMQTENASETLTKKTVKFKKKREFRSNFTQFLVFLQRNFNMKYRNKSNLLITFAEAPLLGLIIAFILRLAPIDKAYNFYQNINIGTFIFISIIVFIFLGLSNSIEEILSERKSLIREKMLNIKISYFLCAKLMILALFAAIQVGLYLIVSNFILGISSVFLIYFIYLFMAAVVGSSIGVLISSFLHDTKATINILPLILIPQIIFGGAIIRYEDMNRQIKLESVITHNKMESPIPEVVYFMPSYYLFEGLYTAQAKLNIHTRKLTQLDNKRKSLVSSRVHNVPEELRKIYAEMTRVNTHFPKTRFTNEHINLSVNMMDGRLLNKAKDKKPFHSVFLASRKIVFGKDIPAYYFNLIMLVLYTFLINLACVCKMKYFFTEKR